MVDSAGSSSISSRGLATKPKSRRGLQGTSSITSTNPLAPGAPPVVSIGSQSFLVVTKTSNSTVLPVTVTSTEPPSTITVLVSQIATLNTSSTTQSLVRAPGTCYGNRTSLLVNCATLTVAITGSATAKGPSSPAVTTIKKSAGNLFARNPIAQLMDNIKILLPFENLKQRASGTDVLCAWIWCCVMTFILANREFSHR